MLAGVSSSVNETDTITEGISMALVRERNIPTERTPLVGEVSANFCGKSGVA
jgi:hypothetical protein